MTALRVGRIADLNMYPLYHGLEQAGSIDLAFTDGRPTALNRALLEGALDVSAISSIEWARNADQLNLLPVASITAAGAVDSIQLFSRVPFSEVRSVAVTTHSATSVALLRILLGPRVPPFEEHDGDLGAALEHHDGVLLIGDEALHGLRSELAPHTTDLAQLWRERTDLPMVFAVWAARADTASARPDDLAALSRVLTDAHERFAADPRPVISAAAVRYPFSVDYVRDYLGRLRFGFGQDERAGLVRFLDECRRIGLLQSDVPVAA
jgi:chorismate dehydratase